LIVPFPAGGGADQVGRIVADKLQTSLGQSLFVENRPGANGIIGTQAASTAPPDGYSILLGTIDTHSTNAGLQPNLPYAPDAFIPIAPVIAMPMLFAVSKQGRAKTLRELVDLAKRGEANYGHWGAGSLAQITTEIFKQQAGLPKLQGIPYQGAGPALQALLAGQIDVLLLPLSLVRAQADRLDVIGLASKARLSYAKDYPTMAELGYPVEADAWMGLFAPPRTPPNIVDGLRSAANEMMAQPDVQKRFIDLGLSPHLFPSTEAYSAYLTADRSRWAKNIAELGIKVSN
jgi:tripartite-type tricarboxylate transporter receptor subunit TctC